MDTRFNKCIFILFPISQSKTFKFQQAELSVGFSYFNWNSFVKMEKLSKSLDNDENHFTNPKEAFDFITKDLKISIQKQKIVNGEILIHLLDAYGIFKVLTFLTEYKNTRLFRKYGSYMNKLNYPIEQFNIKNYND